MLAGVVATWVDVVVSGHDLLGAEFSEKTQLIAHTDEGSPLDLFAPWWKGRALWLSFTLRLQGRSG
jgi:hypothetical protein